MGCLPQLQLDDGVSPSQIDDLRLSQDELDGPLCLLGQWPESG